MQFPPVKSVLNWFLLSLTRTGFFPPNESWIIYRFSLSWNQVTNQAIAGADMGKVKEGHGMIFQMRNMENEAQTCWYSQHGHQGHLSCTHARTQERTHTHTNAHTHTHTHTHTHSRAHTHAHTQSKGQASVKCLLTSLFGEVLRLLQAMLGNTALMSVINETH